MEAAAPHNPAEPSASTVELTVTSPRERAIHVESRVTARKSVVKGVIRVSGSAVVDEAPPPPRYTSSTGRVCSTTASVRPRTVVIQSATSARTANA